MGAHMAKHIKNKEALIQSAAFGDSESCVIWPYSKSHNGYAQTQWKGKIQRVNRVVCEMAHGPAPKDKPLALHTCGNRACINANHLYWGDWSDNYADAVRDETAAYGERNGNAKLTNDEVCEIVSAFYLDGVKRTDLAEVYGVHPVTISRVINGDSYINVECEGDQ